MCTASAVKLQEHVDSKHSKNGFEVRAQLLVFNTSLTGWQVLHSLFLAGLLPKGTDCLNSAVHSSLMMADISHSLAMLSGCF